jgi:hypothetical protein
MNDFGERRLVMGAQRVDETALLNRRLRLHAPTVTALPEPRQTGVVEGGI